MTSEAKMQWHLSWRADQEARKVADRHYNRQKVGSPQFVPPGRCLVLKTEAAASVWVTSWPFAEYVKHSWAGAWMNTLFRRERGALASDLIRQAIAATRWHFGAAPSLGMVTFVDPTAVREKANPGYCYLKAGFKYVGETLDGKLAFQILPAEMPDAEPYQGAQLRLTS